MIGIILAAAMASLPPRPQPPGPESWTFKEELAAPVEGAAWNPVGEPWLKERISRCFFGPIKREPYYRDELMDDVDYYPDGYLAKLQRDGVNGLWITVEFHEIAETRFFPRDPDAEKRIGKLRRTVEKCGRYGIKVWIFVLEPKWLKEEHPFRRANPGMFVKRGYHFAMCPELPEVREYLESAAHDVFSRVPGLGGIIGITHGEDITSCFSYGGEGCPRCSKLPRWRLHNGIVAPLAKGVRRVNPEASIISWFYQPGAKTTRPQWVYDCAGHLPEGVTLMYNFESGVLAKQCDRWRVGGDYWLSKPGPGAPFEKFSGIVRETGGRLAAKIQMACSHEDATVPYVPVPGLLYRKFKAMKECGVESSLLSWYFGNYPCVMSKAAGRLAYEDFSEGEEAFLLRLAAEDWGNEAGKVAACWKKASDAYAHYPLSNYMQYYGPYHCGVVWALRPHVEMRPLEPTWMPHFEPAGDAVGECLRDFTLDEALSLAEAAARMPEPDFAATNRSQRLDAGVMKAVRRQFLSARNIFEFYRLRSEAVYQSRVQGNNAAARGHVSRMRRLVADESRISREMIPLCREDSRLGFHSEAEAHQFFPARLEWRIDALARAESDLADIDRILAGGGRYPESDHEKNAPHLYLDDDAWADGADGFRVRAYRLGAGELLVEGELPGREDAVNLALFDATGSSFALTYRISREGVLTSPVWNGEPRGAEPAKATVGKAPSGGWAFTLTIPASVWGAAERLRPGWMYCYADGWRVLWPACTAQPPKRLWHPLDPRLFGRIRYSKPPLRTVCKPYESEERSLDTNKWYGARMAQKRAEIAASNGRFDLVFVGDSITHYWEKNPWTGTDGAQEFAELSSKYSILNLGFGGDRTENVLWRLQNGQADGYKAKCMMLMIGTNNGSGPVEDVARGVGAIIDLWREKHPESTVLLVSVLPRDIYPDDAKRKRMERLNELTERYVDGVHVWRIDMGEKFLTGDGLLRLELFRRDRVHLNGKGYRIWREAVEGVFDSLAGDTRPYEFIDANRTEDEIEPLVDFESDGEWKIESPGRAEIEVSSEKRLFGEKTLKVTFEASPLIRIRPPKPLELPGAHGWFASWIRNDPAIGYTGKGRRLAPSIGLAFRDGEGRERLLPLRNYYGNSKLDWPDWWYAVRRFSCEERKFLDGDGVRFDGFALTAASNTVPCTIYFDNIAFFSRDDKTPLAVPEVPEVPIPTRPQGALPYSGADLSSNETVRADAVTMLRYSGRDGRLEYEWRGSPESLTASWNGGPKFRPFAGGGVPGGYGGSYTVSISGKTLILDVFAPQGTDGISMGHVDGAKELSRTLVPAMGDGYWWDNNRSRVSAVDTGREKLFVLAFPDWYVSQASAVEGRKQPDGTYDRFCVYRPKTDGTYNPVFERVYITVSPEFMETLPVVANPPSPWKHVTGRKAWCRYCAGPNRRKDKKFLTWLHRHGIRELVINEHECCMRDDGESFTFREKTAPRKGGDDAWRDYADYVINKLGYMYGPYNNFTDLSPVNANWSIDHVSRKSPFPDAPDAGGLVPAWTRCYAPKAAFAYASCARYAPLLKKKFGFNTAYCDVHTAILPWEYVDCDARVPDGGKFQPFYRAYAAILLEQKKAWQGPVYSEGNSHFFYAGLADGNYGQLGIRCDKDPWIVDFDLRRLHPLQSDFGVGNPSMFMPGLPSKSASPELEEAIDRFLAATLAFGHTPFLVLDMMMERRCDTGSGYPAAGNVPTPEIGLPYALRSYFMVQPAAALYSQSEAKDILYYFDDGSWRGVSAAVMFGDRELQRIAVSYADGTCVVANGHRTKRIVGTVFGRKVDLPPCGYLVWNDAGALAIEASDRHGTRCDYSASGDAIYLDTRKSSSPVKFDRARGKGIAVCRREGEGWELIPVRGAVAFRIDGVRARAFGEDRSDLGETPLVRDDEGFAQVVPVPGALSYSILPAR